MRDSYSLTFTITSRDGVAAGSCDRVEHVQHLLKANIAIENGHFPQLCGCLPEGNGWLLVLSHLKKYGSFSTQIRLLSYG